MQKALRWNTTAVFEPSTALPPTITTNLCADKLSELWQFMRCKSINIRVVYSKMPCVSASPLTKAYVLVHWRRLTCPNIDGNHCLSQRSFLYKTIRSYICRSAFSTNRSKNAHPSHFLFHQLTESSTFEPENTSFQRRRQGIFEWRFDSDRLSQSCGASNLQKQSRVKRRPFFGAKEQCLVKTCNALPENY